MPFIFIQALGLMVRFICIYFSLVCTVPVYIFNPCHIYFILETYVVSVDIDDVPVGHHDVPCQNPNKQSYIESIQQLINVSQTNQQPQSARDDGDTEARAEFALDVTKSACSTATETASEEEEVIGN